jgi:hypothetical protein
MFSNSAPQPHFILRAPPSSWLSAVIDDPAPRSAKDAPQTFLIIIFYITSLVKKQDVHLFLGRGSSFDV